MINPVQYVQDLILEKRIQATLNRMISEPDRDMRRAIAQEMGSLIKQRSAAQVERMERERGLR